ncbi:tyrocidine synthase 3 [Lachnospiraceae bacterium]|nr:tyrocidine synthase 3 [Lachnospiraceae bacterium]
MYELSKPQRLVYDMEKYAGGAISVICGSLIYKGEKSQQELENAVNHLYQINDALRMHVICANDSVKQEVDGFVPRSVETLNFMTKEELDVFAGRYAKEPHDLKGELCEIKIIFLSDGYGLLIKMHHLIGDAWTMSLICSQFNCILKGEGTSAYSYTEYLKKEDDYRQSGRFQKDRTFFLEQFKKCDEVVYLSEKKEEKFCSERKSFAIDKGAQKRITDYAEEHHVSVFVLFMTALAVYLNRVKDNAEKFYLGSAVINRTGAEEKHTAGVFVNVVPILIELDNRTSFEENLYKVQQNVFSVFRHQKYHYGDVLSDIRKEYHFSEKLYDVVLNFQNAEIAGAGGEFESTWYHNGMQTESLQIHIDRRDGTDTYRMHYDYQTGKFRGEEIQQMHQYLMNLLTDAMENDSKKLYELDLLSVAEQNKILYDFNKSTAEYPRNKSVHCLFEEQVLKIPDEPAVIARDKILTYLQLNEQANRIAHSLMEMGVKRGDLVAFALPRKSYLLAAIFGILKAGAAYLPIDPEFPEDRVNYILKDSQAKIFITDESVGKLLENEKMFNPEIHISGEDLCYCIYTSGTTGNPKGVLVRHRNLINICSANERNCYQTAALAQEKILLSTAKCCFDAFAIDYGLFLLNGSAMILADDSDITDGGRLAQLAVLYHAEVLQSTPSTIRALCLNDAYVKMLRQIKVLILAAENLTSELYAKLRELTDAEIFNGYGPSETTVGACIGKIDMAEIHMGEPVANTQIYVVDRFMQPVPVGVKGELCIAGDGVSAGYLNRPELTAEKFVDNPFGDGKLYRTGDYAYWRWDGKLVYAGRRDFQVKIRGLRVELEEIEKAIAGVEGISQACVVVRKSEDGRQMICGFYTGKTISPKKIRSMIKRKIPRYMVPHILVPIDEMPLTNNGKVNHKMLPKIDLSEITAVTEFAMPQTREEKIVTASIESVLGISRVGILDNFFDLGGDSLKAIELIARLEENGYFTDVEAIFSCDTVKELAGAIAIKGEDKKQVQVSGKIPVTSAQMRVYTAQSMQNDSTVYNMPYAFKVKEIDVDRLWYALTELLNRHDILRTYFVNEEGVIVPHVAEQVVFALEKIENGNVSAFIRPFDLSKAPLIRAGYCENLIVIDIHHMIADGGSMPVILHELNELYMGRPLEDITSAYQQFAMEITDYTKSEEYWLSVYHDEFPNLELKTDYNRGRQQNFEGSVRYDFIDLSLHYKILDKCQYLNITPYMFYIGAFYILLSKFSGNEDIVIGIPVSGRNSKYLHTIGMFVNTIAFRSKPSGMKSVHEFLEEIKKGTSDAIENQNYPYGELIKKLNVHINGRNPLFDVMFTYQSESMSQAVFGDHKIELVEIPATTSKYDFTFNIIPSDSKVVIMLEYCTGLYQDKTVKRFIDSYQMILKQMLAEEMFLKDISAVTVSEEYRLKKGFNNTEVFYSQNTCVHQLFQRRVLESPDQTAVVACDQTLSYGQLNRQANRIAHSLLEKGVQTGDLIAFALPRESYLIAVIFGILKAGAAYMPVDMDYPQARVEYMLSESKAKMFITKETVEELLDNEKINNPDIKLSGKDICYCIFTSGSTGNPKGILISHSSVVNFVHDNRVNAFQNSILKNCDYFIASNSISFDIVLQEIHLPLLNGRSVLLLSDKQMYDIETAAGMWKDRRCGLIITPTKLQVYMSNDNFCRHMKYIRVIMCGAEVLPEKLVRKIRGYTDAVIFNGYGPTETTCGVLYSKVDDETHIAIGKPTANTKIYIVDKYLHLTPIGVAGEICIAGDCVGNGYLNRPEQASENFIDNPFGSGKLYRTGDTAYWREDGEVVYVGRNDFQVKIRGLRIELEEISNTICSIDGVDQAVVLVRNESEEDQLICAFYTGNKSTGTDKIRETVKEKLPQYMMPHVFTYLPQMPLTANGKVDQKTLLSMDLGKIERKTEYKKPEGEVQKQLAIMMEQVLNYDSIGCNDDFFELDGDSLKAIEFVSKAHNEGIYFSLQNVFDHPTLQGLSECIEKGNSEELSLEAVDFTEINRILERNNIKADELPEKTEVGNILLAGATGYLGIHILADFLEHDKGMAYCLVRGSDIEDSRERLKNLLKFYFGDRYFEGRFQKEQRIKVICADLQKDDFGLDKLKYMELTEQIHTVIHAAASVKHYGSYQYFDEVNVGTTRKLVKFCMEAGARLIHTSTLGVSGNSFADTFDGYTSEDEKYFYETNLYIGQPLDNVYARSKFNAEKVVLENMGQGLRANIMRMGNLTNRSDGMFQQNYATNAFLMRIKAVLEMRMIPDYLKNLYLEFTPIDAAASAVMTLARHFSMEQTVFHINSNKVVYMDELLDYFQKLGCGLEIVSGSKFTEFLRRTMKESGREFIYETFINDMDSDDRLNYDSKIRIENSFTVNYLKRLGFEWPEIGLEYLRKYINYFRKIGYLEV